MKPMPPIPTKEELEKAGIRIAIGIPMPKSIDWKPFYAFWGIAQAGWPVFIIPPGSSHINRHKISLSLLANKQFTHVQMLDADHKWDPYVVLQHARWILRYPEIMVVGGMHHRRCEPYDPCAFHLGMDNQLHAPAIWADGLMKVDAIGSGSLLISRKLFETIPPPWWDSNWSNDTETYPGEDMFFSALCRKHNIPLYVDTTITSKHMAEKEVDKSTYEEYKESHPVTITPGTEKHLVVDGVIFQLQSGRPAGISRIWQQLLPELAKAMPGWKVLLLRREGFPTDVPFVDEAEIPPYDMLNREQDTEMLTRKCNELDASCFMSTYYTRANTPTIQLAYDMIPEATELPNNSEWQSKREAFEKADKFISISQSTAKDLKKFYGRDSTVALCGVSDVFQNLQKEKVNSFRKKNNLPKDYVLLVGNRAGYKNGQMVFEAVKDTDINLVCAGGEEPQASELMDNVYFFPHCKPEVMALLYNGALCTVYPSLYEGFGLPVLESLACGCPVIAGKHTSISEAGGEAVIYCDVSRPGKILKAIRSVEADRPKTLVNGRGWDAMAKIVAEEVSSMGKKDRRDEKPRALLSYVADPRILNDEPAPFSNIGIARAWVKMLAKLGYAVDIIDWKARPKPGESYDLVVYHGGWNYSDVLACAKTDALKVYFSTGIHCDEFNSREEKRFADLQRRRGKLPYDRRIEVDEKPAYEAADGIISLGNGWENTFGKEAEYIPIGAYLPKPIKKNYQAGKKKFLFFSGWGNVHKGLDLLLEAFDGIDAELYIATRIDPAFADLYSRELGLPNIHVLGWLDEGTKEFDKAMKECDWAILPSCAEGQPGSVLDCMARGLIPITTKECNLDEGIRLPNNGVEEIRKTALEVSQYNESTICEMAAGVLERTQRDHSPEAFAEKLEHAYRNVAARKPLVSALVSVYNCEKYIRGCLEDLEAQTIADRLEIVIVDTGSEQNEKDIAAEFVKKYPNIIYQRCEKREPISVAWNHAAQIAHGKYLTSANTDDRHAVDGLWKLMNALDENPEVGLVYGNQYRTKTDNAVFGDAAKYTGRFDWHEPDLETLKRSCYCGPMPMWRKTLHVKHGCFDETLTSAFDWEFWLRLAKAGVQMKKLSDYVGLYLERGDSVEHQHAKDGINLKERIYVQDKHCPECARETLRYAKANGMEVENA